MNISFESIPQSSYVLNKNITSRFFTNSTVLDIIYALVVEDWNDHIQYESYYQKCAPLICFYTITTNFNIATVITTIIGLFGGLSVILRIIIPPIIIFLRQNRKLKIVQVEIPISNTWNYRLMKKIREINIFQNAETNQSIEKRYYQIIATRLYIFLLITSILILAIYTGLSNKQSTVRLDFPSMDVVNQHQFNDHNEFSCPCLKMTIPFQAFTSLNFTFHQICSSDLISNHWLEGLFNITSRRSTHHAVLAAHFKLLQSFCQYSKRTLIGSIQNFYVNQFISPELLAPNEFNNQIESFIQEFQRETISSYQRNLDLIIDITLGNQLMSVYETNWYFILDSNGNYPIYTKSRSYGNCSCGTPESLYCTDKLLIDDNTTVPGMSIGCLPITSLRLSSLQCFYNQICLDKIKDALDLKNVSMISLDPSQLSRCNATNTTLSTIIDNLMLEDWKSQINYTAYFNECSIEQCTYLVIKKENPLVIFTTLLSLYGGLTIALKFLALSIIKMTQYMRH